MRGPRKWPTSLAAILLPSPQPLRPRLPHRVPQNVAGPATWNCEFRHQRAWQAKKFGLGVSPGFKFSL